MTNVRAQLSIVCFFLFFFVCFFVCFLFVCFLIIVIVFFFFFFFFFFFLFFFLFLLPISDDHIFDQWDCQQLFKQLFDASTDFSPYYQIFLNIKLRPKIYSKNTYGKSIRKPLNTIRLPWYSPENNIDSLEVSILQLFHNHRDKPFK